LLHSQAWGIEKNDAVVDSWGDIMLGLYNDKSMRHVYFAFVSILSGG